MDSFPNVIEGSPDSYRFGPIIDPEFERLLNTLNAAMLEVCSGMPNEVAPYTWALHQLLGGAPEPNLRLPPSEHPAFAESLSLLFSDAGITTRSHWKVAEPNKMDEPSKVVYFPVTTQSEFKVTGFNHLEFVAKVKEDVAANKHDVLSNRPDIRDRLRAVTDLIKTNPVAVSSEFIFNAGQGNAGSINFRLFPVGIVPTKDMLRRMAKEGRSADVVFLEDTQALLMANGISAALARKGDKPFLMILGMANINKIHPDLPYGQRPVSSSATNGIVKGLLAALRR